MRGLVILACLFVPQIGNGQATKCAIGSTAPWSLVNRSWSRDSGRTWSNDSVRRVLLRLVSTDQDARRDFAARSTDSTYVRQLIELDRQLSSSVKVLLDRFGLP